MDKIVSGIVDSPLNRDDADKLQMQSFENALVEFIQKTATPISIALQGEWGSGKTSLMNRLDMRVCQASDARFYPVWLNTWHYALTKDKRSILFEIIASLIEKVLEISKQEHPEKLKYLIKDVYNVGKVVFKGISKIAIKTAVSQIDGDAADAVNDAVFKDKQAQDYNLSDLRNKLNNLVKELVQKNAEHGVSKEAFVFFIDDLDRIEPTLAVNILELLKNIFDLDHCIFVLAIDYEVVVKGLRDKFGELTQNNEREFRSFFDKIIQLPFQMPVRTYIIDEYVKDMLLSVGFINEKEARTDFIETLVKFTNLSVGSNPRSIKRLTNTLSFVNLLIKSKNHLLDSKQTLNLPEKHIIYALTCFQTAFPAIFNLLSDNPHVENWSDEFAKKHNIKIRNTLNKGNTDYFLDEKWKEILYIYCNNSKYLRSNFFNIVSMINEMQLIAENHGMTLSQMLPESIDLLSVTNIKSTVKPKIEINNIRVLFALNKKLLPVLERRIRAPMQFVKRKGRMIAKLSYLFDEQKTNNWVAIYVYVKYNNLYLKVGNSLELFPIDTAYEKPVSYLENRGKTEVFNQLVADYMELNRKYVAFSFTNKPQNSLIVKKQKLHFEQHFQLVTENVEYLYTDKLIEELAAFIVDFMELSFKIVQTDWEAK